MVSGPIASRTVAPYLFEGSIQAVPRGFIDMFVDGGRLEVDPATLEFYGGLTIETNGYLVAWTPQDRFVVGGDFLNHSEQTSLWDTVNATLVLSANGTQCVECPGEARGDTAAGWNDNFAWGRVEIREGARVEFVDGNTNNQGTAFYVGVLDIEDNCPRVIEAVNRLCEWINQG